MAVDFAAFIKNLKTDGESGGGADTSASSGTTGSALGEKRPQETTESFHQNEVRVRVLPDERLEEAKIENQPELTQADINERRARDQAHALGLNQEQSANLELAARGAGRNVDATIQASLPKITGIDPAILAMAAQAVNIAPGNKIANPQSFVLATGNDFGSQAVGPAQDTANTMGQSA